MLWKWLSWGLARVFRAPQSERGLAAFFPSPQVGQLPLTAGSGAGTSVEPLDLGHHQGQMLQVRAGTRIINLFNSVPSHLHPTWL